MGLRISIITPTYNAENFLTQTISSVVGQNGDFDIEYILVDGQSSDKTLQIIDSFISRIGVINAERKVGSLTMTVVSEPDSSMYEAIGKGFELASGDILAWINADDFYLPGAFSEVVKVFSACPKVQWLKGVTAYFDEDNDIFVPGKCYLYAQSLIRGGLYGKEAYFIQQDSVFWRSGLLNLVGGIDQSLKLAGDYDLWLKFAKVTPLYSVNFPVSCFRRVRGQLSENLTAYRAEQTRYFQKDDLRTKILRKYFKFLEHQMPNWINFFVFRLFFPLEPLYYIDPVVEPTEIRSSFKYLV